MSTTSEFEIKVSKGRIINEVPLEDGTYKVIAKKVDATTQSDIFELVEASTLSLKDEFMRHEPRTDEEKKLKERLTQAIKGGLKDFYKPKCDPSFTEDGTGICYVPGNMPAVGRSYNWWSKHAKEFWPERKSRLGVKNEYDAFLGVFIKRLVANGWSVEDAWYAVCNDSKELGHYWNSKDAKHTWEATGSREMCGFFDLSNTFKILAEDEEAGGFWLAGGNYFYYSCGFPLAFRFHDCNRNCDDDFSSVGWLVLEK